MASLNRRAQAFVVLVCLLGLCAALAAPRWPPAGGGGAGEGGAAWELALFLALGLLAGGAKVRLTPRRAAEDIGSLSLSFALIFATLLRLGPGAAMLVGCLSTLSSCLYPRRQPLHQVAFNLGLNAAATCAAGRVFLALHGASGEADLWGLFGAVMASCLSFFLLNTGGVAGVIALSARRAPLSVWRESFLWTAPSYFAAASAGTVAIVILGPHVGTVVLFVTPVAALTYLAYALSRRHADEGLRRIAELQAHEAQLSDALRHEHLIAETLQRSLL